MVGATFKFVELYAGYGGFSAFVKTILGEQCEVMDPLDIHGGWDILTEDGLKRAEQAVIDSDHAHIAWPCRSFTRGRRSDEHGEVEVIRSDERPEGWNHPLAVEGNEHLSRVSKLVLLARLHGTTVSLENPWDSFAWICKPLTKVLKVTRLQLIRLDQCAYGAKSKKPTCIATDAAWVAEVQKTCDQVQRHYHVLLEGKVWDPGRQRMVWRTSLAAQYPAGLCMAWAESLKRFLDSEAGLQWMTARTMVTVGKHRNVLVRQTDRKMTGATNPSSSTSLGSEPSAMDDSTKSRAQVREEENIAVVGGLRDPRRAVARSTGLQSVGLRLRNALEAFINEDSSLQFEANPCVSPFSEEQLSQARAAVADEFNVQTCDSGYQKEIIRAVLQVAADPDCEVLYSWLSEGFPLGVKLPIINTGIFPKTDQVSAAIKASQTIGWLKGDFDGDVRNYDSFYEAGSKAQDELDRVIELGWATRVQDWQAVVNEVGPGAVITPLACIIKVKDGKEKIRLVVDMRRSGVNGRMQLLERIILPRISDLAKSAQELARAHNGQAGLEFLVADFSDAFYTMAVHPSERSNIIVKDAYGHYCIFNVCCFGLASAPLLWGRLCSMLMRLSQSTMLSHESRIQCYVDDPIIVAAGNCKRSRTMIFLRFLLVWTVLGFKVAFRKVQRGNSLSWIGVDLILSGKFQDLIVKLSEEKSMKLRHTLEELVVRPVIPLRKLQHAAGVLGWLSSIIPVARPWVAMLWGAFQQALSNTPKRETTRSRKGLAFRKQVEHAVNWLLTLLEVTGKEARLTKVYPMLDCQWPWVSIEADACPQGMGAVLRVGGLVKFYWQSPITDSDLALLGGGATRTPEFQAEFETLALLVSLKVFPSKLGYPAQYFIRSDNVAALQAALNFKAKSPLMTQLVVEIILELESQGLGELTGRHLAGLLNDVADKLSRGEVPSECAHASVIHLPVRDQTFFRAWPKQL